MNYIHEFIFGYYPYIALLTFIIGCISRYEYAQYEWKSSSSQLLRKDGLRLGNNLFHIGIIFLFFGHLIGLLTPSCVYSHFITPATKQLVAMTAGGIAGSICFVGLSFLLYRRLFDLRIRVTSKTSDILILIILYIQLILGLMSIFISAEHPSGESMKSLAHWAQDIITFSPNASDYIIGEHWIFKLHIFLGLTIFLIFPFTRLVHVLSAPVGYIFRTGYQIVRKRN